MVLDFSNVNQNKQQTPITNIPFNLDLSKVRSVEVQTFDAKKFEGTFVKIASVTPVMRDSYWGEEGVKLTTPIKTPAVLIETEPFDYYINDKGEKIPRTIKTTLNLKTIYNPDGSMEYVVSKHPKSKLNNLMKRCGVPTPHDLIGHKVMLITEISKQEDDDRLWLRIQI